MVGGVEGGEEVQPLLVVSRLLLHRPLSFDRGAVDVDEVEVKEKAVFALLFPALLEEAGEGGTAEATAVGDGDAGSGGNLTVATEGGLETEEKGGEKAVAAEKLLTEGEGGGTGGTAGTGRG